MDNSPNPKQRNFVTGLIIIGLLIIVFFGLRTVRAYREFHSHRPPPPFATKPVETDVGFIRDWMTIPFVSKMYHVPPGILFEALGISPQGNQEKSLKQLNEEYFARAEGPVLEMVKAAILAHQSTRTPVPSGSP
ncbi:MAG TPA: hypothetical protein VFH34_02270 [Anaerolineales bacterium]|nr:hypothetical protein [Anaerolineales bacterium]